MQAPHKGLGEGLPRFLKTCVDRGLIDSRTAQAIESQRSQEEEYAPNPRTEVPRIEVRRTEVPQAATTQAAAPKAAGAQNGFARTPTLRRYVPTLLNIKQSGALTFDTFVPSSANWFAFDLAQAAASGAASRTAYNPVFLHAGRGVGKTHLLSAIANAAQGTALLINAADLELELERAIRTHHRAELRRFLVEMDVLLIDDIQVVQGNPPLQREILAVVDYVTRTSRSVVLASDLAPRKLKIDQGLLSRLVAGVVVRLEPADLETRVAILRAAFPSVELPAPVIQYLASRIDRSIRKLKAAVSQLLVMQESTGVTVDLDIARALTPLPDVDCGPVGLDLPVEPEYSRPSVPEPHPRSADLTSAGSVSGAKPTSPSALFRTARVTSGAIAVPAAGKTGARAPAAEGVAWTQVPTTDPGILSSPVDLADATQLGGGESNEGFEHASPGPVSGGDPELEQAQALTPHESASLQYDPQDREDQDRLDCVEEPTEEATESEVYQREPGSAHAEASAPAVGQAAQRFKQMLAQADSEEEQAFALQIAVSERIRQLRQKGGNVDIISRLETSLTHLREGRVVEAIQVLSLAG